MITVKNKKQTAQNAAGWSGERDRRKKLSRAANKGCKKVFSTSIKKERNHEKA
jgi:hypothetical protein